MLVLEELTTISKKKRIKRGHLRFLPDHTRNQQSNKPPGLFLSLYVNIDLLDICLGSCDSSSGLRCAPTPTLSNTSTAKAVNVPDGGTLNREQSTHRAWSTGPRCRLHRLIRTGAFPPQLCQQRATSWLPEQQQQQKRTLHPPLTSRLETARRKEKDKKESFRDADPPRVQPTATTH